MYVCMYVLTFYFDTISDIYSNILSGIYSDIFFGILSGILADMLAGIYSDMLGGIYSGILSVIVCLTFRHSIWLLTFDVTFSLTWALRDLNWERQISVGSARQLRSGSPQ